MYLHFRPTDYNTVNPIAKPDIVSVFGHVNDSINSSSHQGINFFNLNIFIYIFIFIDFRSG